MQQIIHEQFQLVFALIFCHTGVNFELSGDTSKDEWKKNCSS